MAMSEQATLKDYELLGLQPGATAEDVRRAYRELAKRWHPDRYSDAPPWARLRAEEKFKDLQQAYQRILSRPLSPRPSSQEATRHKEPKAPEKASSSGSRTPPLRPQKLFSKLWLNTLGKWAGVAAVVVVVTLWGLWAFLGESASPWKWGKVRKPEIPVSQDQEVKAPSALKLSSRLHNLLSASGRTPVPDLNIPGANPFASPAPASTQTTFGLGSTERDVLRAQGPPDRRSAGRWSYGLSEVRFQGGRVVGYDNFDGRLRVLVKPTKVSAPVDKADGFFTLGSTKDEVLHIQGTPTGIRGSVWHYGFSSVRFVEDRVAAYDNSFGNLKVRLLPSREYLDKTQGAVPLFFTIGSTADEVLAVQGTPTSVRGNMWFYDFSDVLFRNGRVGWVNDPQSRLRFMEKEALAQGAVPDRE